MLKIWWGLVCGAAALLVLPLFVVDVPPILDYPNHLARLMVLAVGTSDPILSQFYEPRWAIIPNLALDLVGPALLHWFPVYVAGRLILGAVLLLSMIGVIAYHRALFRQRLFWPIGSALIAYNALFLFGFINYLISLSLALLVGALWIAQREKAPIQTSLLCAGGTAGIFFCHFFGVLFVAILIGSHEAERLLQHWRRRDYSVQPVLASAGLVFIALIPAAVLLQASAFNEAVSPTYWLPLSNKLAGLFAPLLNYNGQLDLGSCLLLLVFVGLCALSKRWRMPVSSRIAMTMLLSIYLVAPFITKGGAWIDVRFSLAAGFMLFAGCSPDVPPRRAGVAISLVFVALFAVRMGVVVAVWIGHREDLRELRASIAAVPPGARVLVVRIFPSNDAPFMTASIRTRIVTGMTTTEYHEAALLVIERRAFWPLLFANPAQQPIIVRPAWRDLSMPSGVPPDYHALLTDPPPAAELLAAPYLAGWRSKFDDVLVLDAETVPDLAAVLPNVLSRVNATGFAALYKIKAPSPAVPRSTP